MKMVEVEKLRFRCARVMDVFIGIVEGSDSHAVKVEIDTGDMLGMFVVTVYEVTL